MLDALKKEVCATVDRLSQELIEVSHEIHGHPELAFEEVHASRVLTDTARRRGLDAHQNVYGLETAIEARVGDSGPTVAVLSEYDALPGIGHACGHNIIATSGLGAALALAELGARLPGRVRWLGTPAEERGAGKELMARRGAFQGVDAAMMIHPSGVNLVSMPCLALSEVGVSYAGLAAHAAAMPERAAARFYVRAADAKSLAALKARVEGCFRAGAEGTGAKLSLDWADGDYLELDTSWPLANRYQANAESLGRSFFPYDKLPAGVSGSTDMGNVSHLVPSIHPMLACSPPNVTIHNAEFAKWAGSDLGDKAVVDGAKSLAMTALDYLCDADLRSEVSRAFAASRQAAGR